MNTTTNAQAVQMVARPAAHANATSWTARGFKARYCATLDYENRKLVEERSLLGRVAILDAHADAASGRVTRFLSDEDFLDSL